MADVGAAGSSRLAPTLNLYAEFGETVGETVSLAFLCSLGLPPGIVVSRGLCFG